MLEKYTQVYVDGEEGEWVITAAWALDDVQRKEVQAIYGYEVSKDKRIRIVYNTQVTTIK